MPTGLPLAGISERTRRRFDLIAAVPADAPVMIAPGARAAIPTGICIALPPGTEGQVRPRAGLALRHGVTVLNAPGTIDGTIVERYCVVPINHGGALFTVERGLRIAQLVIAATMQAGSFRDCKPG